MKELTFKGFLAKYVKELSYSESMSMTTLAEEAVDKNIRLLAPLILYAVAHEKGDLLRSKLLAAGCAQEKIEVLDYLEGKDVEKELEGKLLPVEYQKVWNSFKVRRNRWKKDDELKTLMRKKIREMQTDLNLSNYRIYKDLNLNPGNINSWLKHGEDSKVSFQTAERILTHLMELERTQIDIE